METDYVTVPCEGNENQYISRVFLVIRHFKLLVEKDKDGQEHTEKLEVEREVKELFAVVDTPLTREQERVYWDEKEIEIKQEHGAVEYFFIHGDEYNNVAHLALPVQMQARHFKIGLLHTLRLLFHALMVTVALPLIAVVSMGYDISWWAITLIGGGVSGSVLLIFYKGYRTSMHVYQENEMIQRFISLENRDVQG